MKRVWLAALFLGAACGEPEGLPPETGAVECADGLDNDEDGLFDCDDADCANEDLCLGLEVCNNGVDDDGNGLQDCADPRCTDAPNCVAVCGDNIQNQGNEDCDGNDLDGESCQTLGFDLGTLTCGAACDFDTSGCFDAVCGDTITEGPEECDDGNLIDEDGCSSVCVVERCGEGDLQAGEGCDDGNTLDGDGCSSLCTVEFGFDCEGEPSQCLPPLQLAVGFAHTCALDTVTGQVFCWGDGSLGQLGYGNTDSIGDNETPAALPPVEVGDFVIQVVAGRAHTCALLASGNVRCWGQSLSGQLGYGNSESIGDDETPIGVGDIDLGGIALSLSASDDHTCALLTTGNVRCWGFGASGRLGYANNNNVGDNEDPALVGDVNVGGPVSQIVAGGSHTCALLETGAVRCWGLASDGRLGYGNGNNVGDNEFPFQVGDVEVGAPVLRLSLGANHSCALLETGAVRCWGLAASGQLGYGNTNNVGDNEDPAAAGDIDLGGASVGQLVAAGDRTCAVLAGSGVICWGENGLGQLGYGNTDNLGDDETPAGLPELSLNAGAASVLAGNVGHSCVGLTTGGVICWGDNALGQLGYGNTDSIGDDEAADAGGLVALP